MEIQLEYGVVKVVAGKNSGRIGYYDDDDGSLAIVYFGHPTLGLIGKAEYQRVCRASLAPATIAEATLFWDAANREAEGVSAKGCRSRRR